ncbi:hypothetical protein [Chlorobium sp. N1]|uniref:hypothetical protein n=1 Tax=Chlorobium sp. N1 TaxID=2491138 RepID=UPI00103EAE65|nr:hypothetical protein [Chlorobium sp. N1]TCD48448.1 hypothetical protein E0L29_00730 [Chlorobium sp. N1]
MTSDISRKLTDACTALDGAVSDLLSKKEKIARMSGPERRELSELLDAITEDLLALQELIRELRAGLSA